MTTFIFSTSNMVYAQSLGINTTGAPAVNSAILDITSADKGMLIPRMSKLQRIAIITPATGLMIYQNTPDSTGFYYYDGTSWLLMATSKSTSGWLTTGNSGTTNADNFFGNTDNIPLSFRQNNKWLGRWNGTTNNYFSGDSAGINTTGYNNIGFGSRALQKNVGGTANIAIGNSVLQNNTSGTRNTGIGDSALQQSLGSDNVAVGFRSLSKITIQSQHVAVGSRSLTNTTASYPNTAVGYFSQDSATNAYANTSLGSYSLSLNKTGFNNTAIGNAAMYESTSSTPGYPNNNTAIGNDALRLNRYYGQVAVGSSALRNDTSGTFNTAVGHNSLNQNLSGLGNVAVGSFSMMKNKVSGYNTAIGFNSFSNHNVTGYNYNTAIGSFAMELDSSGYYNTGVGTSVFRYNNTGFMNTGVGLNAGNFQKQSQNTFVGAFSGVGERAPSTNYAVDTGRYNTSLGASSLFRLANGNSNVAVGYSSLYNDSSGLGNVGVGANTLYTNTTGNNNTALGNYSNVSSSDLTNATAIGANAYIAQSNSMVLGSIAGVNSATSTVKVGIGENAPEARLHITGRGNSGGTFLPNASMIIEDNTQSYIQLSNPTLSEAGILSGNAATTVRSGIIFSIDSSLYLRSGGNNNQMTVYKNGYVGIGTTNPLSRLHISEPTLNNINLRIASIGTGYEPGLELVKPGITGADWKIKVNTANSLMFSKGVDDFVTAPTDYYEMTNLALKPATDGGSSLGSLSNRWATVYATSGIINTSDRRDKENIENLNYGLPEIMKLRPVSYNWKENPQWGRKIGFIAQEVKPILKEVVQTGDLQLKNGTDSIAAKTDKLGIYYSDIIPVAVKAIQEQQIIIEKQAIENAALKERIEKLEKAFEAIKENGVVKH